MTAIEPMTAQNIGSLGLIDRRQFISEIAVVSIASQGFRLQYRSAGKAYWRDDPVDDQVTESFILSPDHAGFFAFVDGKPAGQVVVGKHWNGYAFVHELAVDARHRRLGIGRALLSAAQDWAMRTGQYGLMLETQDVNATACQFYEKCGFVLGGVDNMLYSAFSDQQQRPAALRETALFFYRVNSRRSV
ncbi:MAG: GNAT family N-acetyltransferase [Eubacteriales bacterium]|nr:GNAT family N-acetyltransferase [Eubacteriales bacterium]MDD3882711.1 GNAT family N-acetyltransferase [Eubacteriales bacterium]MDD4512668.1 GNAT family N-acetyltransferase [Eubacteriales bacterium]